VKELLSPKQVARAIGVSESSLKRWCDQGLIPVIRTAGGHRKLPIDDVIRFLRERQHKVVSPEVLRMPVRSEGSEIGLARGRSAFMEALITGNEMLARRIVLDLYLAKHAISVICDEAISGAFHDIGELWACQSVDVYQERRGCEITLRVLYEIRRTQPDPDPGLKACGGTLEGDQYSLTTTMAELVLREAGLDAVSLGSWLPVASMVHAIEQTKPKLFWISASHIGDPVQFLRDVKALSEATTLHGVAFAVGGRALTNDLLNQMTYTRYCESMQQLAALGQFVQGK
jgi:MerR family transcriptional regulator, light-induced transcriptional regulator